MDSPAAPARPGERSAETTPKIPPEAGDWVDANDLTIITSGGVQKAVLVSPCRLYRYWLARQWTAGAARLPIIMLNPSTADADKDDPTIRRCMAFARREGFGGIHVFNLFAYRATAPADMKAAVDPVGPMNDHWLIRGLQSAAASGLPVLPAWGAHGRYRARDGFVRGLAHMRGARLVCLGKTAGGDPRHPLYVRGDQPFVDLDSDEGCA